MACGALAMHLAHRPPPTAHVWASSSRQRSVLLKNLVCMKVVTAPGACTALNLGSTPLRVNYTARRHPPIVLFAMSMLAGVSTYHVRQRGPSLDRDGAKCRKRRGRAEGQGPAPPARPHAGHMAPESPRILHSLLALRLLQRHICQGRRTEHS